MEKELKATHGRNTASWKKEEDFGTGPCGF